MSRRRRPQVEIALDDLQQALIDERREVFRVVNQLTAEAKREVATPTKATDVAAPTAGKQKKTATPAKATDTAAKLKEATERYELVNDMLKAVYELDIKYRS